MRNLPNGPVYSIRWAILALLICISNIVSSKAAEETISKTNRTGLPAGEVVWAHGKRTVWLKVWPSEAEAEELPQFSRKAWFDGEYSYYELGGDEPREIHSFKKWGSDRYPLAVLADGTVLYVAKWPPHKLIWASPDGKIRKETISLGEDEPAHFHFFAVGGWPDGVLMRPLHGDPNGEISFVPIDVFAPFEKKSLQLKARQVLIPNGKSAPTELRFLRHGDLVAWVKPKKVVVYNLKTKERTAVKIRRNPERLLAFDERWAIVQSGEEQQIIDLAAGKTIRSVARKARFINVNAGPFCPNAHSLQFIHDNLGIWLQFPDKMIVERLDLPDAEPVERGLPMVLKGKKLRAAIPDENGIYVCHNKGWTLVDWPNLPD